MKLSIILTVFNRPQLVLTNTLVALAQNDLTDCEILIVDDGSTEDYTDLREIFSDLPIRWFREPTLKNRPSAYNINGHNNPAYVNNFALARASGERVCMISSDCILPPHALATMLRSPDCVWVPRVVNLDDAHVYCGVQRMFPMCWMLGAKRQSFIDCGLFDERYLDGMAFEDNEFTWRLFAHVGKLVIDESVTVWHQSHPAVYCSDDAAGYKRSEAYTLQKHGGIPWDGDWFSRHVSAVPVGRQVIMRPKEVAVAAPTYR